MAIENTKMDGKVLIIIGSSGTLVSTDVILRWVGHLSILPMDCYGFGMVRVLYVLN